MPHNPVQVVLNPADFIVAAESKRRGYRKEFFPINDGSFQKHKQARKSEVAGALLTLSSSHYAHSGILRIRLRPDALAKTHRPTAALFVPDHFPCVGAGGLGELFYFATEDALRGLSAAIESAEDNSRRKKGADGKEVYTPSDARSEVGSIQRIEVLAAEDKRRFSAEAAVSWLADPSSLGGYVVELFAVPTRHGAPLPQYASLLESLAETIRRSGPGTFATTIRSVGRSLVGIELNTNKAPALVSLMPGQPIPPALEHRELDTTLSRHESLLDDLARHPLVRRISLPFRLALGGKPTTSTGATVVVPAKVTEVQYPRVGVVDNGISKILGPWVLHRHDYLTESQVAADHGTFIAGLLTSGNGLNGLTCPEPDGCELIDIALFPSANFKAHYPTKFDGFLEEVETAVAEAVEQHQTRVFNLSINIVEAVESDSYSYAASRLDQIADRYGVVFVNSAGNLDATDWRAPWPQKAKDVLAYFAGRATPDTMFKPAESARTISVGALNPPHCGPHIAYCPTTYTRRGPGMGVGQKPDLAHVGGSEGFGSPVTHGLKSIAITGAVREWCGTSFAAPLVAKTLAGLDARTLGKLPNHTLRAFLIHHASVPQPLESAQLRELARQFVGFGVPASAGEMVQTDDSAITLVFGGTLEARKTLSFPFSWPQSLVRSGDGSCAGAVKMTLVYDAPLDPRFGTEVVRVNLDAKLRQRVGGATKKGKPKYESRVSQCFLPKTSGRPAFETELINHGLKWWPVKRYEKIFPDAGIGASSDWLIQVDSIVRAEAIFPTAGVPFSLIVTMADPDGQRPIFQEVRRSLLASRAKIQDIQVTAARVRARQ